MRKPTLTLSALVAAAVLPFCAAANDLVAFLEGATTNAIIDSIDEEGVVRFTDNSTASMEDLYQIVNSTGQPPEELPPLRVELLDGSVFLTSSLAVTEEQCSINWRYDPSMKIGLDLVRSFRLKPDVGKNSYQRAIRSKREEYDQLWVEVNGDLQLVKGVIEKVDAEAVEFEWEEEKQRFARDKIYAIVTADIVDVDRPENAALVELSDGSRIAGERLTYSEQTLRLHYMGDRLLELPWRDVTRITVNTGRLSFLSDLQPTATRQKMIVAPARSWQRDRSVGQHAMKITGRSFSKGVGMTSGTSLKFFAGGQFDLLSAAIGIDDETQGRGDCIFVVRGDSEELYRQSVRGNERPVDIKINVAGVETLELAVEYGNDLDLADHADWGDIRLVKGK